MEDIVLEFLFFVLGVVFGYIINGLLSLNDKQEEREQEERQKAKQTCAGCKYLYYWNDGSVSCSHLHGDNCLKLDFRPLKEVE